MQRQENTHQRLRIFRRGTPPEAYLAACCDEWLQLNRSRIKESTYVKYWTILHKHIKPSLGQLPVKDLDAMKVESFSHFLLADCGLAPKTVRDILAVLRSVLQHAGKRPDISLQPVQILYPKLSRSPMRILSRQEQSRFISYLLQDMDACKFGVLLSLLTGLRIGEVCALQWGSISLTDKTISICATMQRLQDHSRMGEGKTKIMVSQPKSDTSTRLIPLTEYAARLCRSMQCHDPAAYVLTGSAVKYMEPRLMQYRLERYTQACGLENVHFHTLRHTFATRCIEVDFEIKSLSEILGHSSPRITLERYVHPTMEVKRSNMDKLTAIGF